MHSIGPAIPYNRYKLGVTLRASRDSATSFCEKKWLQGKKFLVSDTNPDRFSSNSSAYAIV
jgi:hypothetical protein